MERLIVTLELLHHLIPLKSPHPSILLHEHTTHALNTRTRARAQLHTSLADAPKLPDDANRAFRTMVPIPVASSQTLVLFP